MEIRSTSLRRELLVRGILAPLAAVEARFSRARKTDGARILPWLDVWPPLPRWIARWLDMDRNLLDWRAPRSFLTPSRAFFCIEHHGVPRIDQRAFRLAISGLVARPLTLSLDELRSLPRREIVFAMECAGNSGRPGFEGAIGNARWSGTPLAAVLERTAPANEAIEVVFHGADRGDFVVPYQDGDGVHQRDIPLRMPFARSMSLDDALAGENLLCYEMNGEPLLPEHGFPLRLIAPGWYGVANVKWLERIELRDRRFEGPFMSERYVTIRAEPRIDGNFEWTRTSVGRSRLKSIPARVVDAGGRLRIEGAAWGAPVARVEVRIDDGKWNKAVIDDGLEHDFAWKPWHFDWLDAAPGVHRVTSRAIDSAGNVQPAADDPRIATKRTYWESNGQITRRLRVRARPAIGGPE